MPNESQLRTVADCTYATPSLYEFTTALTVMAEDNIFEGWIWERC